MKTNIAIALTYIGAFSLAITAYVLAPQALGIPPIVFGIVSGLIFYLISKFLMHRLNKLNNEKKQ